ncbi:hypothetical protein ACFUEM_32760 [Streptomyces anulatus]|uniref:hypothetical protein n=1 Tax=Streptomyces anulatus TaxID=1892 RepID=UPI0035DF2582
MISRWVFNEPDAAVRMSHIAEDSEHSVLESGEQLDVDGALVFACLLYLTGPESAQFWWQLAAGAGSRAAMYCLHLHHLKLGEAREALHWYHQLMESTSESAPPDATFIEGLEIFARYIRISGNGASAPTGRLESEVDRLASSRTGTGGLSAGPTADSSTSCTSSPTAHSGKPAAHRALDDPLHRRSRSSPLEKGKGEWPPGLRFTRSQLQLRLH